MINSNIMYNRFQNITESMNTVTKTINRGGLKDTVENLFYHLKNEEIQHIKSTELKGIDSVEKKYEQYDNVFKEMTSILRDFKTKSITKLNDLNSKDVLNIDLTGLKESFQKLENYKIDGDKLFKINTDAIIGDGIRVPRTFDENYIKLNGSKISDLLEEQIQSDTPDLDKIQAIEDFINTKQAEIGARWTGLKSTKSIYENTKLTEQEFMNKRYLLEEAFLEMNNLTLSYEALGKTLAKISSLSLVNYM